MVPMRLAAAGIMIAGANLVTRNNPTVVQRSFNISDVIHKLYSFE
ncbi:hypothetical protein GGI64_000033 [Rhizobium leguminosarum]|uniref:Uncharacterized protein n=1 Tax=Rhizobium leguminosarum TaxID=384 RepID=A0A7Z0DTV3_RHILE|nr:MULTISPECIES: hypothetical protein [Rhizobium]MBB3646290.1 hypothetical protein [Rhizobium sp. BK619]NYJ09014.1 hypothetical protein [Rhizobium leguminosarum]